MKKKFISPKMILIGHGITGMLFSLIFIFIFSSIPCNNYIVNPNNSDNKKYYYSNYLCKIKIYDKDNKLNITEYLEKVDNYFSFKNTIDEIFTIILGSITFLCLQYLALLVIKNLSPAHFIFSIPITFLFQNLTNLTNAKISNGNFFSDNIDSIKVIKFILDFIGNIISIFGFLIYLEIIVLKCCGLDYNINENINEREEGINNNDESISFNLIT
jgi:hypothetical protein